jgi:hypothetical protein
MNKKLYSGYVGAKRNASDFTVAPSAVLASTKESAMERQKLFAFERFPTDDGWRGWFYDVIEVPQGMLAQVGDAVNA